MTLQSYAVKRETLKKTQRKGGDIFGSEKMIK